MNNCELVFRRVGEMSGSIEQMYFKILKQELAFRIPLYLIFKLICNT